MECRGWTISIDALQGHGRQHATMTRRALTISVDARQHTSAGSINSPDGMDLVLLAILYSDMTPSVPTSCRTDAGQMVIPASIAIALTCPFVKIAGPLPTYDMISP